MLIVELGLKFALVFAFFFIIPYIVGCLPALSWRWHRPGVASAVVFGTVLLWAVFFVIAVPCVLWRQPFSTLTALVSSAWGLCVLLSLRAHRKKIWGPLRRLGKRLRKPALSPLIAAACIAAVTAVPVALKHQDEDDAYYVAVATDVAQSGAIYGHAPYTGAPLVVKNPGAGVGWQRVLAPFSLLIAYYAVMTGVHPAVMCHTVLPGVLIPLAFAVYFLWAGFLFPAREDRWIFLVILCVALAFGGFSAWTRGSFLLLRVWQGKAVLAAILLPLLFLLLMQTERQGLNAGRWFALLTTALAADLTTATTILFVSPLLAVFCLIMLLKRRVWSFLALLVAGTPALAQGLAFRFAKHLIKFFA